jgi:type VI secretion system protein ImpK
MSAGLPEPYAVTALREFHAELMSIRDQIRKGVFKASDLVQPEASYLTAGGAPWSPDAAPPEADQTTLPLPTQPSRPPGPGDPLAPPVDEPRSAEGSGPSAPATVRVDRRRGTYAAAAIANHMRQIMQRQAAEAARIGGQPGARLYEETQYVLAAIADEIFLGFEWDGHPSWQNDLMETQLFGTHVAGERVFERVEQLLRSADEEDRILAWVYHLALSLGFQGRYRGAADLRPLRDLQDRLLGHVLGQKLELRAGRRLAPVAYAHTVEGETSVRLPPVRFWATVLVLSVLAYVLLSVVVWSDVSGPLREIADRLRDLDASTPLGGGS